MKSVVFTCALIHLHFQRNRSYYLEEKNKVNVETVNLIEIVQTLVE